MSVLSAEKLSYAYPGAEPVVRDFSLELRSNERVALSAPSGQGKSTVCQLLAGYLAPLAGEVRLDGVPIAVRPGRPNPVQLIWQHPEQALDPYLRIRRSLEEVAPVSASLVEGLGIRGEWLDRFPHELSGGELQRCCIARALSVEPRFIIADETSTMLDAISQVQIFDFLLNYCAKNEVGMLVVTHSRALQDRLATRVVEL